MIRHNRLLSTCAVVLLGILSSACIPDTSKANATAAKRIAAAGAVTRATESAHMTVSTPKFRLSGPVKFDDNEVALDIAGIAPKKWSKVVHINGKTFYRDASGWHELEKDATWRGRIALSDPLSVFALLSGVEQVNVFGGVQVNGIAATRYDAKVSLAKLQAAAAKCTTNDCPEKALSKALQGTAKTFPIQVYLDGKGRILRLQFQADMSKTQAESTDEGGPLNAAAIDLTDFGSPVSVNPPVVSN